MTNSIGHGNEVPAPPIRRKTKPNMSKAEKQQFYSQKSKKMGQKERTYHRCLRQPDFLFHKIQHIKNVIKQHKERKKNNGKNG